MANERILIVDDEKSVVRLCQRILTRQGFIVTGKTESHEVPDLLRHETFDVLLTDIRMPQLNGLDLLQIAKEIDPHITVVLITGYGTMEDAIRAISLGARGFLMKPFNSKELLATVEDGLTRRTLLRDSVRLQTLLPLLEINKALQVSGGEVSFVQQVLQTAAQQIGAQRLAWLSINEPPLPVFIETAVVSALNVPSELSSSILHQALTSAEPVWVLSDGTLTDNHTGFPNIVAAVLPLLVKGKIAGLLTAETDLQNQSSPFDPISLDLLTVLAGQLAIIFENIQLFRQTENLRAFNEDIVQTMTNGLVAVDAAGTITALNPAAAAMLSCSVEQVLHKPLARAISGIGPLAEVFETTLTTAQPQPRREITIQLAPDHAVPISVSTAPLDSGSGGGVVGVIEDLTEIKALEAEHRRLDRLAVLGEMSAVVAHELRNPIAGISAGVEYLTRNAVQGSPEEQGATMIQAEIERVNRILEDILFVARPLQLEPKSSPLLPIINTVLHRFLSQAATSNVTVETQYADHIPYLNLDSQRIEQVFSNFIRNAIQAMPDGGTLTLKIELSGNNRVRITISDTGVGITSQLLKRIFDPFFTTKTRGTGLGLSVARRIIEAHSGLIEVESTPGKGTDFYISLPAEGTLKPENLEDLTASFSKVDPYQ